MTDPQSSPAGRSDRSGRSSSPSRSSTDRSTSDRSKRRTGGRRAQAKQSSRGRIDLPRRVAYGVLRQVTGDDAYANLALPPALREAQLEGRDAGFVTELVNGTCRHLGTYDAILATAAGRATDSLDPELLDVLRLGAHQLFGMLVPDHAAVAATVELARSMIGERVTGIANAVTRKLSRRSFETWLDELTHDAEPRDALALRTAHPRWIVDAYAEALPADELQAALEANNVAPQTWLAARPGLIDPQVLIDAGAEPTPISPFAWRWSGDPSAAPGVTDGTVGVQDPGSQAVALGLANAQAPAGRWLDLCAGPGGKTALLTGLARAAGDDLLASEVAPHRADLVRRAVRAYDPAPEVVVADGTHPTWQPNSFARVLADVPCTGLGALRRRPESRWRRRAADLAGLVVLQTALLHSALDSAVSGGLVGYVTCSPHPDETHGVVDAVLGARADVETVAVELPGLADATDGRGRVQLWPHRHGTDAMFLTLLRRS